MSTIIEFAPRGAHTADGWRNCERDRFIEMFAAERDRGQVDSWATGMTETGDPQFYLIGPPPSLDCILSVSRLGKVYVLEDGTGRLVFESADFDLLLRQARAAFKARKTRLLAQVLLAWATLRHAFEEKVEPLLVEGEEMLTHVAPQLASMA